MSGTSTLCQIIRSGNSRFISATFDEINNIQSGQNCAPLSTQGNVTQNGKVVKTLVLCDESLTDYIKSSIIFNNVKDISLGNNTLPDAVTKKLKELIMIHEIRKYMYLPSPAQHADEELTVLGITDLPKYEFSYAEKLDVKCCVETLLRQKIHEFLLKFESSQKITKDLIKINENKAQQRLFEHNDLQLIEWKEKIDTLLTKFENDILKCRCLLNAWRQMKYNDANILYYKKAGNLLVQGQVAEVQAKITKLSCLFRMFKETPVTIDAFKKLNTLVDEKLSVVLNEVKRKEGLKKNYESLEGTEYDKILQNYLELCKAVKRKKHILDQL